MYRVFILFCGINVANCFFCHDLVAQINSKNVQIANLQQQIKRQVAIRIQQVQNLQQVIQQQRQNSLNQVNHIAALKKNYEERLATLQKLFKVQKDIIIAAIARHQQQEQQKEKLLAYEWSEQAEQAQCKRQLTLQQQQEKKMKEQEHQLQQQIAQQQQKLIAQEKSAQTQQAQCQQQLTLQQQQENIIKEQEQQIAQQQQELLAQEKSGQTQPGKCQQTLQQLALQLQQQQQKIKDQEQRQREHMLELQQNLQAFSPSNMSRSEIFHYLGSFLNKLSSLQCHNHASEIIGRGVYKLQYILPKNLTNNNIEVKVYKRVIYVKACEGQTVLFENIELLPANVNLKEADYQLMRDTLEIFIPLKDQPQAEEELCKADNAIIKTIYSHSIPAFNKL